MSQDCFLNSKDGENCGSSRGLSGLVRLSQCSDEVKHHLISCHLSKEVLSENKLILARTGLFYPAQEDKQKMWICYRYRHALGKFWRSAKVTCQYPGHAGVRKRIQGRNVITLSRDIQKLFGVNAIHLFMRTVHNYLRSVFLWFWLTRIIKFAGLFDYLITWLRITKVNSECRFSIPDGCY